MSLTDQEGKQLEMRKPRVIRRRNLLFFLLGATISNRHLVRWPSCCGVGVCGEREDREGAVAQAQWEEISQLAVI